MALNQEQRVAIFRQLMATWSDRREPTAVRKQALWQAIVGFDDNLDAQLPVINGWIPQPARSDLTGSQKLELMLALLQGRQP